MIKKLLYKIGCTILYLVCSSFLAVQLAYFLSFRYDLEAYKNASRICLDPKIIYWQGNNDYAKLAGTLILLGLASILFWLFTPSKTERQKKNAERRLTKSERMSTSKRATTHEAKKGMVRFQFNKYGNMNHVYYNHKKYYIYPQWWLGVISVLLFIFSLLGLFNNVVESIGNLIVPSWRFPLAVMRGKDELLINIACASTAAYLICSMPVCDLKAFRQQGNIHNSLFGSGGLLVPHFRDFTDFVFNPLKHWWNIMVVYFRQSDMHKMNELKYWKIDGKTTCRRAGIPIITKKNMVWVHAEDNHSGTIGTTNSGKTWSIIKIMIACCGMSGHCMIINDLKGELYEGLSGFLKKIGYNVRAINFRDPTRSDCWNPFGLVVKSYREEEKKFLNSFKNENEREHFLNKKKSFILKNEYLTQLYELSGNLKRDKSTNRNELESKLKKIEVEIKTTSDEIEKLRNQIETLQESDDFPHANYSEAWEYLNDICDNLCREKDAKNVFFWQQASLIMFSAVAFLLEYTYIDKDTGELKHLEDEQINFQNIKLIRQEGFEMERINGTSQQKWKYYLSNYFFKTDKCRDGLGLFSSQASESLNDVLKTFDNKVALGTLNENISKMLSRSTFNFEEIAEKKTAIFLIVHDEKSTYYPFTNIFINQFYIQSIRIANQTEKDKKGGKLPIPLDVIWDEFGISPKIDSVESMFAACRSRGVRWHIVMQNREQLMSNYGKEDAKTIESNIVDNVFLLGDEDSAKAFSGQCGKMLKWNKERESFDSIPCFSEDELAHLSLSEAVTRIQRKPAYKTRYRGFDKYVFYKSLSACDSDVIQNNLKKFSLFSIDRVFKKLVSSDELADLEKQVYAKVQKSNTEEKEETAEAVRHVDRGRKENMLKPNFTVESQKKEGRKNHENLYNTLMGVKENQQQEKEERQIRRNDLRTFDLRESSFRS